MVCERSFARRTALPAAAHRRDRRPCVVRTSSISDSVERLSPETLVWKLAAVAAYRSAGLEGGHAIRTSELAALFELFAAQLHRFPESPADYRLQEDEPELESGGRALLVVSISGAGKTAWALAQRRA
jgi:hypothetical protein